MFRHVVVEATVKERVGLQGIARGAGHAGQFPRQSFEILRFGTFPGLGKMLGLHVRAQVHLGSRPRC